MLTGNLKLLVLKLISSKEMSGYELMKSIKERTSTKPSPGSIYPLLEELNASGSITVRDVGRSRKYSLTEQGKGIVDNYAMQKDSLMKKLKEDIGIFCTMTSQSEEECIEALHQECLHNKESNNRKE